MDEAGRPKDEITGLSLTLNPSPRRRGIGQRIGLRPRLKPNWIVVAQVERGQLAERSSQTKRSSSVRIGFAEVETEADIIDAMAAPQSTNDLGKFRRHWLNTINDVAQV